MWQKVRSTLLNLAASGIPTPAKIVMSEAKMHFPVKCGDYTDFYASKEHASNVGTMFRGRENAIMPNWVHLPVGYHGRSSTLVVSGTPIKRPCGLVLNADKQPYYSASKKLDIELEMACVVGVGNEMGTRIPLEKWRDHLFGVAILNDWSARDIQQFEYVPLGPFLGKNFGTSMAPWIVPFDALDPFLSAPPKQDPTPADYINPYAKPMSEEATKQALDISFEVVFNGTVVASPNIKSMYWTFAQMMAHHSVNGCALNTGDILGSGTISSASEATTQDDTVGHWGSLLELTWNGKRAIQTAKGERFFLEDGDEIVLRGHCVGSVDGKQVKMSLGECSGVITPATP